ncbi:Rv1535 domain-containing protein [Mycobacterium sherrisii]|uniref:Uncharacterized protein n=1 Tax=Mycobacterium sherrisii TaxID=243061 RepID=A0A1E3SRZ3_9MYCO|nr:Rv1535 domain-containing protein [Mycobacterium sherrisii]MCV7031248.1 hypothetical protein [Mycobacterium sherrisii]MEC4763654.1 Rv1535 domain-containing protein [Mycobacterium sherrisii]ODR04911.1 hypothetical protein BHQ21_16225 [Mycobacterium sherrisii]ORW78272.1 hypothetical protein AWC25_06755 [Mycobacterium sherrisii]
MTPKSTTDALADPIVASLASVLSVPLFELYALLWRAGIVQIVEPDRRHRRPPRFSARSGSRPHGRLCPDPSAHGVKRPRRAQPASA